MARTRQGHGKEACSNPCFLASSPRLISLALHLTSNQGLTLSPTLRLSHYLHKLANVSHHSIHNICFMNGHIALPENWNDMKGLLGASGKAASPLFRGAPKQRSVKM